MALFHNGQPKVLLSLSRDQVDRRGEPDALVVWRGVRFALEVFEQVQALFQERDRPFQISLVQRYHPEEDERLADRRSIRERRPQPLGFSTQRRQIIPVVLVQHRVPQLGERGRDTRFVLQFLEQAQALFEQRH
jgi:hypothetical protein